ncbi:MAG: nucleotidyltransferase domain-containing protein [Phycisphaeraceae bacterium]|nr:nucleotidyltransferase domain-containing protein [Phycisphaeraceae bacterium]
MLHREEIISGLREQLIANPDFRAAWLGGSDANGRTDEWSDIDLMVVCARGKTEAAATVIEAAVEKIGPIRIRFRLPTPTWHGFEQAFYQLENAPEDLMIDWLIVEEDKPHPWFEKERHGVGRLLFDHDSLVRVAHVDRAACIDAAAKKVKEMRKKFPLFRHLPVKLARRNLPVDAAYFYQALVLRPLVDLLRCVHCIERYDFGFRYLKDDLPRGVYERIARLCWLPGPEAIAGAVKDATEMFESALVTWDETELREAGRAGAASR